MRVFTRNKNPPQLPVVDFFSVNTIHICQGEGILCRFQLLANFHPQMGVLSVNAAQHCRVDNEIYLFIDDKMKCFENAVSECVNNDCLPPHRAPLDLQACPPVGVAEIGVRVAGAGLQAGRWPSPSLRTSVAW